ncbi:MAG TPA: hypothetical protein VJ020_00645 [Anaerolineales bacterium]|nr:hypothetical protein [Anaerolineales bacterium]
MKRQRTEQAQSQPGVVAGIHDAFDFVLKLKPLSVVLSGHAYSGHVSLVVF